MGRFLLYLKEAIEGNSPEFKIEVIDSYGSGHRLAMLFRYAGAVLSIVQLGLFQRAPCVLHIHMASYGSAVRKLSLLLLGRVVGCRAVLHMHGADFVEFIDGLTSWQRALLLAAMRRAERVVVIGSFWQHYVVGTLHIDPARVLLVHNGVPPPADPGPPAGSVCRILALGELGRRKGTGELIDALHRLRNHPVPWEAVLAGNGAVREYRQKVTQLGLSDRVRLPGWIEREAAQFELAACHMLALPSHQEGLPIAILEAMAMGRAIVATPVGAIPDAVVDRETGLIVPAGDVALLAAAIDELLQNEEMRTKLGVQARARFQEYFDIGRTAQIISGLYRELMSTHRGQAPSTAKVVTLAADQADPTERQ